MNRISIFLGCVLASPWLAAQTPLSGNVFDGSGGPLLTGVVYHATSHLTVPAGKTLTVQPGAVVKFQGTVLTIDGTLLCNGTSANPVYFTSIHDDAAGGDTNGNGSSTSPAPDNWYGIRVAPTSVGCQWNWTTVRYTGTGFSPALALNAANLSATDCTFSDGNWGGVDLGNNSFPTLTRCKVERVRNRPAFYGVRLDAVSGLVDCAPTANSGGNFARIDSTAYATDRTIASNQCPGGALVTSVHLALPAGRTLTLGAGVVIKFEGTVITIEGTLTTTGTSANPVYLTSLRDDAAGGDTNGDGSATAPAPDNWYGMRFTTTASSSQLAWTTVRYTGTGFSPAIQLGAAHVTLTDCTLSDGNWGGIDFGGNSSPTITRGSILRMNSRPAIYGAELESVAKITNLSVANNGGGNFVRVDAGSLGASTTIATANVPGGALVFSTHFSVTTGTTLTLGPGVVLKPQNGLIFRVHGTLLSNGTTTSPVHFTSIRDDAVGGDTNGDAGATSPRSDDWYGIQFTTGTSVLESTVVRYTGSGFHPVLDLQAASIVARKCTFSDGNWGGVNLNLNSSPTLRECTFARISGRPALYGVGLEALAGLLDNTASACAGGNFARVETATFQGTATVEARNCMNGALMVSTNLTIAPNAVLNLETGTILKMQGTKITVQGGLNVAGPVIFTSYRDDSQAGDTNGDGPSVGGGGDWYGIEFSSTTKSSTVRRAVLRYTGAGFHPSIVGTSSLVAYQGVRTEFGTWGGFALSAAAGADDLVAYAHGSFGIRLDGGSFALRGATAVSNNAVGIQRNGNGFTGVVQGSLSWGNSGAGFQSFPNGTISYSNGTGIVGGAGNLVQDPQLVDAPNGDLRLQLGSPCIDAGDPAAAPLGQDALGIPRHLDGNLDYVQRVDIGANEYDNVLFGIFGTPSPGNTLTFALVGAPQVNLVAMLFGTPGSTPIALPPWGPLYVDLTQPIVSLAWPPPPSSVPVPIPTTLGVPATLAIQAVGLVGTTGKGNVSNPGILTIR